MSKGDMHVFMSSLKLMIKWLSAIELTDENREYVIKSLAECQAMVDVLNMYLK